VRLHLQQRPINVRLPSLVNLGPRNDHVPAIDMPVTSGVQRAHAIAVFAAWDGTVPAMAAIGSNLGADPRTEAN
jgi:hypothetical protein